MRAILWFWGEPQGLIDLFDYDCCGSVGHTGMMMFQESREGPPMRFTFALRLRVLFAVGALTVAAGWQPASAVGAPPKSWRSELQRQLDRTVDKGVPGTVALVRDGGSSWDFTSGVSNLKRAKPVRLRLRYRIASETKTFVAALVLKLSEEGTLSLDDTVEEWLPGMVPGGEAITVRHLLNHTSGLYNYTEDPAFMDAYESYVIGNEDFSWEPEELGLSGPHSHGPPSRRGSRTP
jgi:D-alanyl-D-alanine carboxypeptidase